MDYWSKGNSADEYEDTAEDSQYPTYTSYKRLVGQFLPQETALLWLWGTLTGSGAKAQKEVYEIPRQSSGKKG